MTDDLLSDFMDEVVSEGAEAVLPQNLSMEWLDHLYGAAIDFLRASAGDDRENPEEIMEEVDSLLMIAGVTEILHHQRGYAERVDPEKEDLYEPLSCYALQVVLEYIARRSALEIEPPSLSDIFDKDRIIAFEQENPEVTSALNLLVFDKFSSII